jgi:hypothetical protein
VCDEIVPSYAQCAIKSFPRLLEGKESKFFRKLTKGI